MTMVKITRENWETEIRELFSGDADWNGENGLEYTSEEAKKSGFESDLDYDVHYAKKKFTSLKERVDYVLTSYISDPRNEEYYDVLLVDEVVIDENTVVACLVATTND